MTLQENTSKLCNKKLEQKIDGKVLDKTILTKLELENWNRSYLR
jgi:hypothetical protein